MGKFRNANTFSEKMKMLEAADARIDVENMDDIKYQCLVIGLMTKFSRDRARKVVSEVKTILEDMKRLLLKDDPELDFETKSLFNIKKFMALTGEERARFEASFVKYRNLQIGEADKQAEHDRLEKEKEQLRIQ